MTSLCPKCGTVLECSIMFNNMFCPDCDHNEGATDEQLENMRIERAKNRAEHHGIINTDVNSLVTEGDAFPPRRRICRTRAERRPPGRR